MNRFTLDWTTYQMVKVHDKVTFPFVLNMNDYLNGYDGIKNKVSEKELEEQKNQVPFEYTRNKGVCFEIKLKENQVLQETNSASDVKMECNESPTDKDSLKISHTTQATDGDAIMNDLSAKSSPIRTNSAGSVGINGDIASQRQRTSQFSDGDFVMIEPEDLKAPVTEVSNCE